MDYPNLQCVPKPRAYKVLLTPSKQASAASDASAHTERTANLRAAFVAPPGFVLLSGGGSGRAPWSWCGTAVASQRRRLSVVC